MRRIDRTWRVCHWILEIHLIDPVRRFGGFYEQLLDIPTRNFRSVKFCKLPAATSVCNSRQPAPPSPQQLLSEQKRGNRQLPHTARSYDVRDVAAGRVRHSREHDRPRRISCLIRITVFKHQPLYPISRYLSEDHPLPIHISADIPTRRTHFR